MPHQAKNNKIQQHSFIDGVKAKSSRQTKLPAELKMKETSQKDDTESVPNEQRQKLINKFYKRIKRVGIWVLSFASSFLCGAFVAFILW